MTARSVPARPAPITGRADRPVTTIVPLPPSYRGGTEEYAYRVAARVAQRMPVRLVTTEVRLGHDSLALPTDGIPLEYLSARELFQRPVVGRDGLDRLRVLVEGSSLVHLHMPFPRVEAAVVGWARRRGIPVVLTYHMDADFQGASGVPGAGVVTWAYRRWSAFPALDGASAVVSNSHGYAASSPVLSRYLAKVRVIYKGVDAVRLGLDRGPAAEGEGGDEVPAPDLFPGAGPGITRVVFVGRMVPYKGLDYLLEAVGRLLREGVDVRAYLAGTGPELARLKRLAGRGELLGRVHFLGFVPDDRIGALYRGATIVACPSTGALESSATCLEEAVALGVPVLGSRLPGAEETIPDDGVRGLLVAPRDPEAIAGGLRRLLARAPGRAAGSYRLWEETADRYLELFRSLIDSDAA